MGVAAIEALLDDQKSIMIGMVNNEMVHVPLNKTVKLHKDIDHKLLALTEVLI
jgi:6-phosphofructokinase 1